MKPRNINLDLMRIIASFMVLSVHVGQHIGENFDVGAKGVQLFFILSGFLAFASLDSEASAIHYYKKRLIRILPTYYFCLILVYLEDIAVAVYDGVLLETLKGQCGIRFLRYVFFVHCFTPSSNWDMWNNHNALWTMSAFVGFYMVAPWLYKIIKNTYIGMVLVFGLLISRPWMMGLIQKLCSEYPKESHIEWFAASNPITELYCFVMGAVLFVAIKECRQYIYISSLLLCFILSSLDWYGYEIAFVVLVFASATSQNFTSNNKITKIVVWLSRGSFTLYLVHPIVLAVERRLWYRLDIHKEIIHGIVLYTVSILLAYFIYYCIISKIEQKISTLIPCIIKSIKM
ncbi:acyltransferase family protein [Butyrivibrio fibrisolvens]|uniref:acyltransferase family protein n=1 Tax=Butyrivibrio fibrisolvens TaxID=831 RepID=UPI0004041AEA|nr:acyltransferase [Butyrivibrio fibrisolvens]